MKESHLVGEVVRRTEVTEESARSVIEAISDLLREGQVGSVHLRAYGASPEPIEACPDPASLNPTDPRLVDALVENAKNHPLGLEFFEQGSICSVSAAFQSHAFTVEAAREKLQSNLSGEPAE